MLTGVSVWGVLVAALSAMVIGTIWYAKPVFGKVWQKGIGLSDKEMKMKANGALAALVVISLVTAYILGLFIVYFHGYDGGSWMKAAFVTSILGWAGLSATTLYSHAVFDPRDRSVMYVNLGNRLVTIVVMGLIIGAFMS